MDNKAQAGMAGTVLTVILVLTIFGIVAAFTVPIAIDEIEANTTTTITQDVGSTEVVNPELNATLDSVGTAVATDNATYTLNVSEGAEETQKTIDNGSSVEFDFNRGTVNVSVQDVNSGSPGNATAKFEHPKNFAWGSGASSIWDVLGLAIVLAAFLFAMAVGVRAIDRV